MAGGADVVAAVADHAAAVGATIWTLVPNRKGAELATAAGVDHLTITVSASPTYSEKNTGLTIAEARAQVEAIRAAAPDAVLDEVISCCFGSPFDGEDITPDDVAAFVDHARSVGVDQVTLADTTGMATPARVVAVLDRVGIDVGLHLHDTRGTALLNAWTGLDRGVTRFDTALGGLGGSPFAPAAVATWRPRTSCTRWPGRRTTRRSTWRRCWRSVPGWRRWSVMGCRRESRRHSGLGRPIVALTSSGGPTGLRSSGCDECWVSPPPRWRSWWPGVRRVPIASTTPCRRSLRCRPRPRRPPPRSR